MACVTDSNDINETGRKVLTAIQAEPSKAEDIAKTTDIPLFRVRGGLRELSGAGFIEEKDELYHITDAGAALLK